MKSELACSCLLGSLLLFTTAAPATVRIENPFARSAAPLIAKTDEPAQAEPDENIEELPGKDESAGDATEPRKPTSLERAKAALAQSDAEPLSQQELCSTLVKVAQANQLPVGFFTNLIWQESRFVHTAISRVGAMGIAQFMPDTAEGMNVGDAFDARDALPASARLLRTLRARFGNLGLVAAAYNAGPKRVLDWLEQRGGLPKETRDYVNIITGRPAEQWRGKGQTVVFNVPRQVPCHRSAAFASAEQAERAMQLQKLAEEHRLAEEKRRAEAKRRAEEKREAAARSKKKLATTAARRGLLKRVAQGKPLRIAGGS